MYKQLGYQLAKIALQKNPTSTIKYKINLINSKFETELKKKLEQKTQQEATKQEIPKQETPEKSLTEVGKELGQKVGRKERFKTWLKQQGNWFKEKGKKVGNLLKNLLSRKSQKAVAATEKGLTDFIKEHPVLSVGLAAGIPTAGFLASKLFSSDHNQK
jgi:ElaB/YqjD/DUF883 family membrane-anchored ribosome-binding protein